MARAEQGHLVAAIRANPKQATELVVLYSLPLVVGHVESHQRAAAAKSDTHSLESLVQRRIRGATSLARRDGAITGTSFYVAMPFATAVLYLNQLQLVLSIAAIYGYDPNDPLRAAELLVLQGRVPDVASGIAALSSAVLPAGPKTAREATGWQVFVQFVRQAPAMIGLQVRKVRDKNWFDNVIVGAEVVGYLIPFVSIGVWAVANARATRAIGKRAAAFYSAADRSDDPIIGAGPNVDIGYHYLFRRDPRRRQMAIGATLFVWLVAGAYLIALPLVRHHVAHFRVTFGIVLLLLISGTLGRLLWVTRAPSPHPVPSRSVTGGDEPKEMS